MFLWTECFVSLSFWFSMAPAFENRPPENDDDDDRQANKGVKLMWISILQVAGTVESFLQLLVGAEAIWESITKVIHVCAMIMGLLGALVVHLIDADGSLSGGLLIVSPMAFSVIEAWCTTCCSTPNHNDDNESSTTTTVVTPIPPARTEPSASLTFPARATPFPAGSTRSTLSPARVVPLASIHVVAELGLLGVQPPTIAAFQPQPPTPTPGNSGDTHNPHYNHAEARRPSISRSISESSRSSRSIPATAYPHHTPNPGNLPDSDT